MPTDHASEAARCLERATQIAGGGGDGDMADYAQGNALVHAVLALNETLGEIYAAMSSLPGAS